jgi:Fe-S cluster biogenesis protein NfuA
VPEEKDFQRRIQRISALVQELDSVADPSSRAASKELVQLLMELHGTGLERILEVVFQSPIPGAPLIDELARDPLVSSLLILYGLHPEDISTRVIRAVEQIRPKLRKTGCEVELLSVQDGAVQLRASLEGHSCGSTATTVRATLEEALYGSAPDIASLEITGLDAPSASGFVALNQLMATRPGGQILSVGSDGMD